MSILYCFPSLLSQPTAKSLQYFKTFRVFPEITQKNIYKLYIFGMHFQSSFHFWNKIQGVPFKKTKVVVITRKRKVKSNLFLFRRMRLKKVPVEYRNRFVISQQGNEKTASLGFGKNRKTPCSSKTVRDRDMRFSPLLF